MWPHVFVDVTEDMECFHEEIFGPVVTVVKADDFDHALHLRTQVHMTSSDIHQRSSRGLPIQRGIKAGMTGINYYRC